MKADDKNFRALQRRLALETAEKEHLQEENKRLHQYIEEFRMLYISTTEYAATIENELEARLASLTGEKRAEPRPEPGKDDQLRENLALQLARNDHLLDENRRLREELDKIRLLYVNTVEHSTFLENELDEKYDEASRLAETDSLTGIYNRLKFHSVLRFVLEGPSQNVKFSLIMFDIDFFKKVNDNFGHDIGDSVLVQVTRIANSVIRKSDIIARWGGEEFMIFLPGAGLPKARQIAERMREKIESHNFGPFGTITCSFGVVEYMAGESETAVLKRVDVALYQAKKEGRNRVVFHSISMGD